MTTTAKPALGFKRHHTDEQVDVFLGDEELGHLDYDSLGWSGIERAETLLTKMANALGVPVVEL
ncbi:hypothetical protein AB4Y45_33810 [Paraburkholderia sp. EG287A]|uniref:hypothetical protein n=1 Tax=Paraburkholderia sp. EG287A TaxID=3237012 RepID=UPI0034D3129F